MTYSRPFTPPATTTNFVAFTGMPKRIRRTTKLLMPANGDGSTLSLDFTTGVLDPRLTFTRSTNATFINSQGYVQYADANMLVNSPMQDAATTPSGWNFFSITGGSVSIPSTGSRKVEATASGQQPFVHQSPTVSQSLTYTLSLVVSEIVGAVTYANICSVDGSASRTLWVNGVQITNTATQAAAGNYCLVYVAGSGAHQHRIGVGASSATAGSCSMTFHSVRVQPGSFTTTNYIPSTLASAFQAPRFEYDPTTRTPRGLLFEGESINYAPYSNALNGPSWNSGGSPTITPGTGAIAPDNVFASTKFVFPPVTGGNVSRIYYATGYPATSYPYTVSVWMKSNTAQNYQISILGSGNTVNIVTPEWQRFQVTVTSAATLYGYVYISNESTTVTADISMWGVQLEKGSGASSYIPTGASQGTRKADSVVMSQIGALNYSTTNGSIYWSGIINKQPTSYITLVGFMTAIDEPAFETFGNALSYFTAARGPTLNIGGSNEVSRPYVLGSLIKYASSVNTLSNPIVAVNLNGSASSVTKSGTGDLRVATRFVIGRQTSETYGLEYPSVTIRSIKYWPTTKTATELNALTTGA